MGFLEIALAMLDSSSGIWRCPMTLRNCRSATSSALSSISILGNRPEPYEVISYCDIRRDMPDMAIAMINKAISLDPNNWHYRYDLTVMRASGLSLRQLVSARGGGCNGAGAAATVVGRTFAAGQLQPTGDPEDRTPPLFLASPYALCGRGEASPALQ